MRSKVGKLHERKLVGSLFPIVGIEKIEFDIYLRLALRHLLSWLTHDKTVGILLCSLGQAIRSNVRKALSGLPVKARV